MRGHRGQHGHSLIEIIVVMTLVGILAAVVMPSGAVLPEMRLRAASERLVSDLRYAQTLARQEGGRVGCRFTTTKNTEYRIVRTAALTTVPDPLKPQSTLLVDLAALPPYRGVTLGWSVPGDGFLFDVTGAPRSLGYTPWDELETVTLRLNAMTATVTIQPISGLISVAVTT